MNERDRWLLTSGTAGMAMPGKAEGTREMTVGDSTVWNATVVHEALANVNHCRPVLLEDLKELMNSYHGADRPLFAAQNPIHHVLSNLRPRGSFRGILRTAELT